MHTVTRFLLFTVDSNCKKNFFLNNNLHFFYKTNTCLLIALLNTPAFLDSTQIESMLLVWLLSFVFMFNLNITGI